MSSPSSHELLRLWTKHLWLVRSRGWFIHEVQWPKSWVEPLYSSVRKALFTSHSSAAPVRWDISYKEILIRESVVAITPPISLLSSYSSVWPLHVHHVLPISSHPCLCAFPLSPSSSFHCDDSVPFQSLCTSKFASVPLKSQYFSQLNPVFMSVFQLSDHSWNLYSTI